MTTFEKMMKCSDEMLMLGKMIREVDDNVVKVKLYLKWKKVCDKHDELSKLYKAELESL